MNLSCVDTDGGRLLFRILPVTLYGAGRKVETYALLDDGSSVTMIDDELRRDLGVQGERRQLNIQCLSLPMQTLSRQNVQGVNKDARLPMKPYSNAVPKLLIGLDHGHLGFHLERGGSLERDLDDAMEQMVEDYFDIENYGVKPAPHVAASDDVRAQRMLQDTTVRVGRRYQTGLLWKDDHVVLPQSYEMEYKRLVNVEKKLKRKEPLEQEYDRIIKD
ncbi:GD10396 [Drosophila simulans]|uniref:GD10396 n=1 Tax=Drosophila simulans TaxID=7240 RepID=B4NV66_DROSI|nr:GD10396 [Drosophila simulans]